MKVVDDVISTAPSSSRSPQFLCPTWSSEQGYLAFAEYPPEISGPIRKQCICENVGTSWFLFYPLLPLLALKLVFFPAVFCHLMFTQRTLINKNCSMQAVLASLTSQQLNQPVALRLCLSFLATEWHQDRLSCSFGPPPPVHAGHTPSFALAMEIFQLRHKREAQSISLLFLNKNALNHLFYDSYFRTGWGHVKLREGLTGQARPLLVMGGLFFFFFLNSKRFSLFDKF